MEITYELTKQDFVEAYSAHRNRNAVSKWSRRLFIWIWGLMAVLVFVGFLIKPERTGSEGPCAVLRAGSHVDCDSVASSSLEHRTAIHQTTRSSWAKNPSVGRTRSSLALGRRLERCGMEKLRSDGGRHESDSVLYLAGLLQYSSQARDWA